MTKIVLNCKTKKTRGTFETKVDNFFCNRIKSIKSSNSYTEN